LPRADEAVRINESTNVRVVIPALEIVQSRLCVVIVPPVSQRIYACHGAGGGERVAAASIIPHAGHPFKGIVNVAYAVPVAVGQRR